MLEQAQLNGVETVRSILLSKKTFNISCMTCNLYSLQDNSELNGQRMEFLVYLSHDEGSQSYDLHHMFLHSLYCAFGTGFQLVWLTHFRLHSCTEVMSCTVMHSLHSQCTVKDD